MQGSGGLTSNKWINIALTYGPTNSALYLNGVLVTNGTGVVWYPPLNVLTNGFSIGSAASNGLSQARGMFSEFATYNYQLAAGNIGADFNLYGLFYGVLDLSSGTNAPSTPSSDTDYAQFDVVTGPGVLLPAGTVSNCATAGLLLTNMSAVLTNTGTLFTFGITGGTNNVPYDVFACYDLTNQPAMNSQWIWLGQGYTCNLYSYIVTNQPGWHAVYVLGTPYSSGGWGLTDAYQQLVSKTNPTNEYSVADGIPVAWKVLHGLNPTAAVAGNDPDGDGLSNVSEYLYGTDPQVSEGMAVFVGDPAGFSAVP